MTPISMQVPPPVVTGIVIPGDIGQKTDKYQEIKQRRREAVYRINHSDEFKSLNLNKKENKTLTPLKMIGTALLASAAFFGLKKLF